jgi:hypothetical protein
LSSWLLIFVLTFILNYYFLFSNCIWIVLSVLSNFTNCFNHLVNQLIDLIK